MKCHYEVLCVNQDVSDEELRKSYRRLALQLHPDKNPDNAEEAKIKFQEIQNAYEVLSDPHERAFYDRNRESILHGEEFGSERKEDDVHLYKYFSASCYSGFNDSDTGFYTVYRQVFELLAARDMKYIESEKVCIPNFGKSDTDLEDVAEFYGYWQSYCTSISFYWVDKYDIRQATNRWVEKRIERENKKIRDKAKKEFNEEVRSLVAFVRKRDKRWEARKKQLEEKVAENARKQTDLQRKLREERLERMKETFEEQKESLSEYEKQLKEMESQFAEEWGISEEEESEEEDEEDQEHKEDVDLIAKGLYCIACEKVFKSEKAYENHEQSRKHQENQAIITALMEEEEAALSTQNTHEEDKEDQNKSEASDLETSVSTSKKKKKKRKQAKVDVPEDTKTRKPLSRKSKRQADDDFTFFSVQKPPVETAPTDAPNIEQNGIANEPPEAEVGEQNEPPEAEAEAEVCEQDAPQEQSATTKLKGKKAKVAKKAQQKTSMEPKVSHVCSVCSGQFNSKNKLFAHLKSAGHAAIKTSKSRR